MKTKRAVKGVLFHFESLHIRPTYHDIAADQVARLTVPFDLGSASSHNQARAVHILSTKGLIVKLDTDPDLRGFSSRMIMYSLFSPWQKGHLSTKSAQFLQIRVWPQGTIAIHGLLSSHMANAQIRQNESEPSRGILKISVRTCYFKNSTEIENKKNHLFVYYQQ